MVLPWWLPSLPGDRGVPDEGSSFILGLGVGLTWHRATANPRWRQTCSLSKKQAVRSWGCLLLWHSGTSADCISGSWARDASCAPGTVG